MAGRRCSADQQGCCTAVLPQYADGPYHPCPRQRMRQLRPSQNCSLQRIMALSGKLSPAPGTHLHLVQQRHRLARARAACRKEEQKQAWRKHCCRCNCAALVEAVQGKQLGSAQLTNRVAQRNGACKLTGVRGQEPAQPQQAVLQHLTGRGSSAAARHLTATAGTGSTPPLGLIFSASMPRACTQ